MHLDLFDYVVGLHSFWNFTAPAIALGIFFLGIILWGPVKTGRFGVVVIFLGIAAFLVTGAVDGTRNAHDVHELENAAQARYGVSLNYVTATDLFGNNAGAAEQLNGQQVTVFGETTVTVGKSTKVVDLYRLNNGSFILTSRAQELPRKS